MSNLAQACASLLLVTLAATSLPAQTLLRWKFAKGDKFAVVATQQTDIESTVGAKSERAALEMTIELAWQVDEVSDDGVATMTQTFTRLAIKTTAPMAEPIVYDSAVNKRPTGTARGVANGLAPLVGATLRVKMDPRGDIQEVTLSDEARQALEDLPDDSKLRAVLTPEGLKDLFRVGGGALPEKEVQEGDAWEIPSERKTPYGLLKTQAKHAYAGVSDQDGRKLHKLTVQSVGQLTPPADVEVKLNVKEQKTTGVAYFDAAAGRLVSAESKLVSQSTRPFRDLKIEIRVDAATKLEIKRQ